MYEFLLAQRHFVALKKYFDFLRVLPATLDQLKRHSDNLQRQGHVLTTLPDAERLKVLASFSYGYLERLEADISALGKVCNENLSYIAEFADESRKIAAQTSHGGRHLSISAVDFKRFSLSRSQWWIWFPPKDVKGLTHELYFRLSRTTSALLDFKAVPKELNLDIHNVFERFFRSLTLKPCECHSHYSRIETWYVESGSSLPGMRNSASPGSSVQARRTRSNEHLRELFAIKTDACSAVHNLNDFLFAMRSFLRVAENELLAVKPTMKLSHLNCALAQIEHVLREVKSMADRMQQWSRP
ncbi:hypothetical protein SAMN04490194_0740 [Pseudomonas migulae]|jgi:hypothetical protein|uniref:Uncharacterized protein n=1 Tax=Pseudomonas migulae TaxID=78543 RepID=A0A1H5FFA6_9PSED|nr:MULTISPECIES: hypothetical protein [Pseudomonas]TWC59393.1 hypothetical protein FBY04_103384 [Pseudomonas sp. SJZ080]SEE02115.1 hypothetical protein SAMN04490194_0740 [Pseudomonas migulae]